MHVQWKTLAWLDCHYLQNENWLSPEQYYQIVLKYDILTLLHFTSVQPTSSYKTCRLQSLDNNKMSVWQSAYY